MRARSLVCLMIASVVLGVGSSSAAADTFTFHDLDSCCTLVGSSGTFSGAQAATAVNDNGDVVGSAMGPDGNRHAYLFKNGQFTLLDYTTQPSGSGYANTAPFSSASDVNDQDFVVGSSSDDQLSRNPFGGTHAVSWQPTSGSPTSPFDYGQLELDTINDCNYTQGLLDCYTAATDVNASDDVTGYGEFLENPQGNPYCYCTFPWLIPGGSRALAEVGTASGPAPDTPSSDMLVYDHAVVSYLSSGINASDQVVVSPDPSDPSDSNTSAIYPGDLHVPFDASPHDGARHAINDSGEVIGTDDSTHTAALLVKPGMLEQELPPLAGDSQSQADAINNDGDVVGYSSGADGCPNAVEWEHTDYAHPINLNVAAPSRDEELLIATDISNTGVIVGQGGPCSQSNGYGANTDPWELTGGSSQPTSTTIACTPAGLPVGHQSACTLTVADTAPGASQTPNGTVSVSSSRTGTLSPANHCTLVAAKLAGQASCQLSYTPTQTGVAVLTASYSGDGVHATSNGTTTVTASPAPPTRARIKSALAAVLSPHGAASKIKALLHHGYSFTFNAPSAGKLVIDWYQVPKGAHISRKARAPKPVLVASASRTLAKAGKVKIRMKLTSKGRKALAHAKRLALTTKASFKPTGQSTVTSTRRFTLKR